MTAVSPDTPLYAAVDLGGSKLRAVVAEASGRVLGRDIRPSHAQEGLDAVLARIGESLDAAVADAAVERSRLAGLGVASPGAVDVERGVVPAAPQLPGWREVPLARLLRERTGLPTRVENDASAAALGEHRFGAGRGTRHMLYVTVSTGVGGGIIIDGDLYRGKSGAAGEVGHVVIDIDGPPCGCGSRGCLEAFASGTAIGRRGEELLTAGEAPELARLAAKEGPVTAEMMARAAEKGDAACREAFREAARYLGTALAGLINIFDPEAIVLGGGVSRAGELIFAPARATMESLAMSKPVTARLVPAELGDLSGALGLVAVLAEARP